MCEWLLHFCFVPVFSSFAYVAANVITEGSRHMARGLIVVVYSLVLACLVRDGGSMTSLV